MSAANKASKKLVNERLTVRYGKALSGFKKLGYFLPKGCSKTLISDAFMASKHGASLYFPKTKDVKNGAQDYTITHSGHYLITPDALDTYKRRFANVSMSTVRLITEMVTLEKTGKNLWCEGTSVESHYYLVVLSFLANDVYQRFKQDTKEIITFIPGSKFDKWVKEESDTISKEARNQVGTIMNLINVNSKRTMLVEQLQTSHRFVESQLSSYLTSTEQNDKLNTFLKAAHAISEGHAMLKSCPDSDERFRLFETEFPRLMEDYKRRTGNTAFERLPTYATENEGCDLNAELLASLTSVMTSDKFNTKRKFDTILAAGVAHPFAAVSDEDEEGNELSRLERVRKIAKKLHGTDKQMTENDLRDFIAEGWSFAPGNKLVNNEKGYQSVAGVNLRVVLRSDYVIGLQSRAYDRIAPENAIDSTRFFKNTGSNIARDLVVAEAAGSSKDLVNTMVNQAYLSKATDSVDASIIAAISGVSEMCMNAAIAKCVSLKGLLTIREMDNNLLPSFRSLAMVFIRAYNNAFCGSDVYKGFISKSNPAVMRKIDAILTDKVRASSKHIFNDRKRRFENIGKAILKLVFKEHELFSMDPVNQDYLQSPIMNELARRLAICRNNLKKTSQDAIVAISEAYEEIRALRLSSNFELIAGAAKSASIGGMSNASANARENVRDLDEIKRKSDKLNKRFKKALADRDIKDLDKSDDEMQMTPMKKPTIQNTAPVKQLPRELVTVRDPPILQLSNTDTGVFGQVYDRHGSANDSKSLFGAHAGVKKPNIEPAPTKMDVEDMDAIVHTQKVIFEDIAKYPLAEFTAASKNFVLEHLESKSASLLVLYPSDVDYMNTKLKWIYGMMDNTLSDIDMAFTEPVRTPRMIDEVMCSLAAPAIINIRIHRDRARMQDDMMRGSFLSPMTMVAFLSIEALMRESADSLMKHIAICMSANSADQFNAFRGHYDNISTILKSCFTALTAIRSSKVMGSEVFGYISDVFLTVSRNRQMYSHTQFGITHIASPLLLLLMFGDFNSAHNLVMDYYPAIGVGIKQNDMRKPLRELYTTEAASNQFSKQVINLLSDLTLSTYIDLIPWTTIASGNREVKYFVNHSKEYATAFNLHGKGGAVCKMSSYIDKVALIRMRGSVLGDKGLLTGCVEWMTAVLVGLI